MRHLKKKIKGHKLARGLDELPLPACVPPAVKTLEWTLEYNDYKDELMDQAALMLTLSGRVQETRQVVATQFSFRLRTPNLIIKVEPQVASVCVCFGLEKKKEKPSNSFVIGCGAAGGPGRAGPGDGGGDLLHQPAAAGAQVSGLPRGGAGPGGRSQD